MIECSRSWLSRLASALIFASCLSTALVTFQRHTALGIFAAGGGRYWVHMAATESDPDRAKSHLRRVVTATQFGAHVAESAVDDVARSEDRARLRRLLAEVNAERRRLAG